MLSADQLQRHADDFTEPAPGVYRRPPRLQTVLRGLAVVGTQDGGSNAVDVWGGADGDGLLAADAPLDTAAGCDLLLAVIVLLLWCLLALLGLGDLLAGLADLTADLLLLTTSALGAVAGGVHTILLAQDGVGKHGLGNGNLGHGVGRVGAQQAATWGWEEEEEERGKRAAVAWVSME